jgi:hypothetical protein
MSIWTHVTGNIRISGNRKLINSLLGEIIVYDKETYDKDEWARLFEESIIPKGSEGSIQYFIFNNINGKINEIPNDKYYDNVNIALWGDLRNFDETDEIEQWFNNIIYHKDIMTRDAVIKITCFDSKVLSYNPRYKLK